MILNQYTVLPLKEGFTTMKLVKFKMLLLLVAMLLSCVLFLSACQITTGNAKATTEGETTTGDVPTTPPTTTTTTPTTEPPLEDVPSDVPVEEDEVLVALVNGRLADGKSWAVFDKGSEVTLKAATPSNGYRFTHWENSKGVKLSESETLTLTANESETYKAYYEVCFGNNRGTPVMDDLSSDWRQGGFDGKLTKWTDASDRTRISFKTPYLLRKGETLRIFLPQTVCPYNPGNCTDRDVKAGDCTLAGGFVTVEKIEGSETGDITKDYRIVSGKWSETITASKDIYVVAVIKWYQHGSDPFTLTNDYAKEISIVLEPKKTTGAQPIGEYWENELEEGIDRIEATREASDNTLAEFFFLSDVHWLSNAQYSPALINYLAEELETDLVLIGGDVINSYNVVKQNAINQEIKDFFRAMEGYTKTGEGLKLLYTLGSHDRNSQGLANTNAHIDEETAYELYTERAEAFGTTVEGNPNHSYYDDSVSRVRYIQFYLSDYADAATAAYTADSLNWVEARITELGGDWTVVLLSHGYHGFDTASSKLSSPSDANTAVKDRILAIKAEASAEIACWLVGGAHVDYTEELTSSANAETLRLIAFASDSKSVNNQKYHGVANLTMKDRTVTEQSFGYLQIDPILKKITVTRFGAGADAVYTYGDDTVRLQVTNGKLPCGSSEGEYPVGDRITITAVSAPKGFCFSHWENAAGETVGEEMTLSVTVAEAASYKAYYEPLFDLAGGPQTVLTNTQTDWRQGGANGVMSSWTDETDKTRVSFKNAYFLRKGETMTVTLPSVVCCVTPGDCPKLDGVGDCTLRSAFVELSKNDGTATGDITQDFTIVKGAWKSSYTATSDVYLTVMIKWDKHGDAQFLLDGALHRQVKVTVKSLSNMEDKGNALGYYWLEELETSVDKIEANRETYGQMSEFIFFTDCHWYGDLDTQYSPALVSYIVEKTGTSFMMFGGDIIHGFPDHEGAKNEIRAFFHAMEGYTKAGEELRIMATLGNHDRNYSVDYPNDTLTEREAYDLFTKRMEGWGVVRGDGDSTASYYDDTQNKVRYVQFFFTSSSVDLPENRFIEGALGWAEERIKELDSDWTVIVMTHGFLPSKGVTIASMESDEKEIAKALLRIKSEARAELACWLVGHNHIDRNEVLQSADRQTRLPVISCASDGYPKDEYLNSIQEQSFSFMQVDTANKKIYLTRIGRGSDQVIRYDSGISATYTFE